MVVNVLITIGNLDNTKFKAFGWNKGLVGKCTNFWQFTIWKTIVTR